MNTTSLYQAGWNAGQEDALAFKLDNPARFRSGEARQGYRDGYADSNPLSVGRVTLQPEVYTSGVETYLVIRGRGLVDDRESEVSIRCPATAGGRVKLVGCFGSPSRRLFAMWLKRFWLSHPDDFRALVVEFMRNRRRADKVRPFFQDYLEENSHPFTGFLRYGWRWPCAWPLFPTEVKMPEGEFTAGFFNLFRVMHWLRPVSGQSPQMAACGEKGQFRTEVNDPMTPFCCPTCYLMQPLPAVPRGETL